MPTAENGDSYYTRDTIARFKRAGVLPDMVQIGNEINGSILWPEGKSWGAGRRRVRPAGWPAERIAGLKASRVKRVKIIAAALAEDQERYLRWWFDGIDKRHVPYDVIGLSMYTYWNGPDQRLKANMDDVANAIAKTSSSSRRLCLYLANAITRKNKFRGKKRKRMGTSAKHLRGTITTIFTI